MAKTSLNPLLDELRGAIGQIVFKRCHGRMIASKYPDMSRVKHSLAQNAQLERMRWAVRYYYPCVLGDPVLKVRYAKRAKAARTTIHRLATKDYIRCAKELGRLNVLDELTAQARASRKKS